MAEASTGPESIALTGFSGPIGVPAVDQLVIVPLPQCPAVSAQRTPLLRAVKPSEQPPPVRLITSPARRLSLQLAREVQTSSSIWSVDAGTRLSFLQG
ncbi:hypothetical protein GCM10010429_35740 [Micromonospora olivasterospora]